MAEAGMNTGRTATRLPGMRGVVADWASDQRTFKTASWMKAMMWIFLLSDTFIFSCFLLSYMTARTSTTVPWPNPSEVFALEIAGHHIPLILIAIMTFPQDAPLKERWSDDQSATTPRQPGVRTIGAA